MAKQTKRRTSRMTPSKKTRNSAKKKTGLFGWFGTISKRTWLIMWIVAFGAVGVKLTLFSSAATFQDLGTHPQAVLQSTDSGKIIKSLTAWNGKIYAGYGDWNDNTGPIALTPFDPATNSFANAPEFTADTEAIEVFRPMGGKLYVPSTDPKVSADYSWADASSGKAIWSGKTPVGMIHTLDMTTFDGNDLWLVGAKGSDAVMYRSTDGGTTWVESLRVAPSDPNGFARFYSAGVLNGKLYTQATDVPASGSIGYYGAASSSWAFDGTRWSKTPLITSGIVTRAANFAGKLVYISNPSSSGSANGYLQTFDGRATGSTGVYAKDYTIAADGYLYVLGSGNNTSGILRTKDLATWETVTTVPSTATSMTALGSYLYIGTYDSHLWRADMNDHSTDNTPPTVAITGPASGATLSSANGVYKATVTATASDASGLSGSLLFRLGTGNYAYGTKNADGTWTATISYDGLPTGQYNLTATIQDTFGNTATATIPVNVVTATSTDTVLPTVAIASPTNGSRVKGKSVTITGSASDNKGLRSTVLYQDGVMLADFGTQPSFSYKTAPSRGVHTLQAVTTDTSGNTSTTTTTYTK